MTRFLLIALTAVFLFSGFAFADTPAAPQQGTDEAAQQIKVEPAQEPATGTEETPMEVKQDEEQPAEAGEQLPKSPEKMKIKHLNYRDLTP